MMKSAVIRTTHLADAADALGLPFGAGGAGMIWAGGPEAGVSGRAFTVQQRALAPGEAAGAEGPSHRDVAERLAQSGDIIVIGVEGTTNGATWGEAHALRAFNRGVAGVLIDGNTRDAGTLAALAMPVFYRGISPLKSTGRLRTVSINGDVEIAGSTVRNGDFVALDADGFVVIPANDADVVLARAQQIADKEAERNVTLMATR